MEQKNVSVSNRVQVISKMIEITVTKIHLMEVFVCVGQWKAGPGQVLAMSMLTALQGSSFREAVEAKAIN